MKEEELKEEVRRQTEALCQERAELLNATERERLVVEVLDETFGLGPLEQLLRDPDISDILINGPKSIYIEKRGRLTKSSVVFRGRAALGASRPADRGQSRAADRRDQSVVRRPVDGRQPVQRRAVPDRPGRRLGARSAASATSR
jgi:Flp pilus assembly CpaF family ATPase